MTSISIPRARERQVKHCRDFFWETEVAREKVMAKDKTRMMIMVMMMMIKNLAEITAEEVSTMR